MSDLNAWANATMLLVLAGAATYVTLVRHMTR